MYRWQTLTLARVERILFRDDCRSGCEPAMLEAAKNILYYVGQQHFPEPEIGNPPRLGGEGPAIDLIWRVEEREMVVAIGSCEPNGATVRAYVRTIGDGLAPPDEPGDRDNVRELAHWLLFGERPPKPIVVARSSGPHPCDGTNKNYPSFAAPGMAELLSKRS